MSTENDSTAKDNAGEAAWVRPPAHKSEVYVNVPKDVHLTPRVSSALDDFLNALRDEPPQHGPDIGAEATCLKISIEDCATLVHCQIGGPLP